MFSKLRDKGQLTNYAALSRYVISQLTELTSNLEGKFIRIVALAHEILGM